MARLKIQPANIEIDAPAGRLLLQLLQVSGQPLMFHCRRGLCGQDVIRILRGAERLSPHTDHERETLSLLGLADPAAPPLRLACCARVLPGDGLIEVELLPTV